MNREIKFRTKCKDNGEWVYGSYISNYNNNDWIVQGGDFFAVDSDTLGQFTGFYDKDDKEIYDGDIFYDVITNIKYLVYFSIVKSSFIFMPCSHFDMDGIIYNSWGRVSIYGKVLGNKFDNPELLEK